MPSSCAPLQSAKTASNVEEAFVRTAAKIYDNISKVRARERGAAIDWGGLYSLFLPSSSGSPCAASFCCPIPPCHAPQGVYDVRNEAHGIKLGVQAPAAPGQPGAAGAAGGAKGPAAAGAGGGAGGGGCC